ncbi:MAG: hypothetical protein Q9165_007026 [Trypethelium subeluteriae]
MQVTIASNNSVEKNLPIDSPTLVDVVDEEDNATTGYVLDPKAYPNHAAGLQLTPDGSKVLIPQPTNDPNDPLLWPSWRKNLVLLVVCICAFPPDYSSAMAAVTMIVQSRQWHVPQSEGELFITWGLLPLAISGFYIITFSNYFGRLPTLFFFQCVTIGTAAWEATATSYNSFLGARVVNGLFTGAGQAQVLLWIKDMYYFHEHPRIINIAESGIMVSPYVGPLLTAFIVYYVGWRWSYWLYLIIVSIGALFIVLFGEETMYDRRRPASEQSPRRNRLLRVFGIEQARTIRQRSFWKAVIRPWIALEKIPVLLITTYYMLFFCWSISVNVTISVFLTEYYHFTDKGIGFFYFFGITGCFLGWLSGHWLHDAFGRWYAARHSGRIAPEARLTIIYVATVLMAVALVIIGLCVEFRWHYMVLAVFCTMEAGATLIATTAVHAYFLDAYPEASGEVGQLGALGRGLGGFMSTYIQVPWLAEQGPARVYGTQAGVVVAAAGIVTFLQFYGQRIRTAQGRVSFKD